MVAPERLSGRVKWYSEEKGYGFIVRDNGSDVYVHHTVVRPDDLPLMEGDVVSFALDGNSRGPKAADVVCERHEDLVGPET